MIELSHAEEEIVIQLIDAGIKLGAVRDEVTFVELLTLKRRIQNAAKGKTAPKEVAK